MPFMEEGHNSPNDAVAFIAVLKERLLGYELNPGLTRASPFRRRHATTCWLGDDTQSTVGSLAQLASQE
eukprot:2615054-Amphidinium_carterae.1